jgi:lambda family phage portal protein
MPRRNPEESARAAEARARKLRADVESMQLRAAKKQMRAALNIHSAADRGRRNADWPVNNASADLANIVDSSTLNGRARIMDRDSWIVRSVKRSFVRNIVGGNGVVVTPHAKDKDGNPLVELNRVAQGAFTHWARSKLCDVERRKTFPQMQRLAAGEKPVVGEHLWMWCYQPPGNTVADPVGLRLQAFEPEQLDLRVINYEGREVRGGVEVDENNAPLAYHIYTRNPNDVLYRFAFLSERVPASRMFHYYEKSRTLQTRGVTPLAPVMQDVRDLNRFREATLWRAFMEACIGLIVKQPIPGGAGGPGALFPQQPGYGGQTPTGVTTADFMPGMVARTVPGEEIDSFVPTAPGNQYDPFTQLTTRGIGAGLGLSLGQVLRHNDANYSAARQDMLEDYKGWEIEHDEIISDLIRPTYELWFNFAAIEGRFDGVEGFDMGEFLAERWRYVEAEYIPPPMTWIDPEKEANALAILLKNRLITREEIIAMRGERIWNVTAKIAAENKQLEGSGLSLPENEKEKDSIRDMIKAMMSNRLGTLDNVATNATDIPDMWGRGGLGVRKGFTQPILPIVEPQPQIPKVAMLRENGKSSDNGDGHANGNGKANGTPAAMARRMRLNQILASPTTAPDYRDCADPVQSCGTCSYLLGDQCTKYNFVTRPNKLCDAWAAVTLTENIGSPNTAKPLPPGPVGGQPELERRFYSQADEAAPLPDQAGS